MSKRNHGSSDEDEPKAKRGQGNPHRNGSIQEQLTQAFGGLLDVEEKLLGPGIKLTQSSRNGFEKRRRAQRKLHSEEESGYKRNAEESSSAAPHSISGEVSSTEKEQVKMDAKNPSDTKRTAAEEKIFEQGMEHGRAQAQAEFSGRATDQAKEAASTFWGKTKALVSAHRGKFAFIAGVAGLAVAEGAVAAYKERQGDRRVNIGDTTVTWDTAGGNPSMGGNPQGGQPGNQNAAGNDGGRGGRGR